MSAEHAGRSVVFAACHAPIFAGRTDSSHPISETYHLTFANMRPRQSLTSAARPRQPRTIVSIPAASSKIRRSDPPAAASIKPTGASPSRWQGNEIAQPSMVLIRVQLRSESTLARCRPRRRRDRRSPAGDRDRRRDQRVIRRDTALEARNHRAAHGEQIHIVGGTEAFAAPDPPMTRGS